MQYNEYSRQTAYDKLRYHIGQAEASTINMALIKDAKAYQLNRRHAHINLCRAIFAGRELWQQDNVIMGAWFGARADWMADMLDDLRNIAKVVDMEQDWIHDGKTQVRAQQRDGMRKAWDRVRDVVSRVSVAHTKQQS